MAFDKLALQQFGHEPHVQFLLKPSPDHSHRPAGPTAWAVRPTFLKHPSLVRQWGRDPYLLSVMVDGEYRGSRRHLPLDVSASIARKPLTYCMANLPQRQPFFFDAVQYSQCDEETHRNRWSASSRGIFYCSDDKKVRHVHKMRRQPTEVQDQRRAAVLYLFAAIRFPNPLQRSRVKVSLLAWSSHALVDEFSG